MATTTDKPEATERWITARDIAKRMSVCERTVWRYVGKVPGFPAPRTVLNTTRFLESEFNEFLRSHGRGQ